MTIPQNATSEQRRIVQIAVAPETKHSMFVYVALCNDGTIWGMNDGLDRKWEQLPEIPK